MGAPVLRTLAERAVETYRAGVPDDVTHAANRALVDWYAAACAGGVAEPARILGEVAVGDGPCGLVPSGRPARARDAALVNGTAAHTAEIDDIFRDGLYHPGAPTIAAALAAAEDTGASGRDLLTAIAVAYEVGCRLALPLMPGHYRYWHPTGTIGAVGAAAAAGILYGLDAARLTHALATATTLAAGLQQAFRSEAMSKPLHAGRAAETGVLAAAAARAGYTGAADAFDGAAGFAAAMSGGGEVAGLERVVEGWGEPFLVTTMTVKNHACCGHTFAAVDAALELREAGITPDRVAAIEIGTYGVAARTAGNPDPSTAFEAKFSLAYCVAAGLTLGTARDAAFTPSALADRTIRGLVAVTTVGVDDRFDAWAPARRAARVTITDTTGTPHVVERHTRRGDPDAPLSDTELATKFHEFTASTLGPSSEDVLTTLWKTPSIPHVTPGTWHPTPSST